ncbi:hypothetical protein CEXT_222041 [Caerostris extrusa]|uniref:Uncharacterized protein n=1 Tax=Caerostris extrusa TaxID=172846 RepID=A0AAV4VVP9_CAEEX|nr:hypothetical protein CEXT_222041 [Caerostris extrusa]
MEIVRKFRCRVIFLTNCERIVPWIRANDEGIVSAVRHEKCSFPRGDHSVLSHTLCRACFSSAVKVNGTLPEINN